MQNTREARGAAAIDAILTPGPAPKGSRELKAPRGGRLQVPGRPLEAGSGSNQDLPCELSAPDPRVCLQSFNDCSALGKMRRRGVSGVEFYLCSMMKETQRIP